MFPITLPQVKHLTGMIMASPRCLANALALPSQPRPARQALALRSSSSLSLPGGPLREIAQPPRKFRDAALQIWKARRLRWWPAEGRGRGRARRFRAARQSTPAPPARTGTPTARSVSVSTTDENERMEEKKKSDNKREKERERVQVCARQQGRDLSVTRRSRATSGDVQSLRTD